MTRPSVPDLRAELLRSMSQDVPAPHAKARVLLALGLAHSAVAVGSVAAAAPAGTATAGSGCATTAVAGGATAAVQAAEAAIPIAAALPGAAAGSAIGGATTMTGAAVAAGKVTAFAYGSVLVKPLLIGALAGAVTVGGGKLSGLGEHNGRRPEPATVAEVEAPPIVAAQAPARPRRNEKPVQAAQEAAQVVPTSPPSLVEAVAEQPAAEEFGIAPPSPWEAFAAQPAAEEFGMAPPSAPESGPSVDRGSKVAEPTLPAPSSGPALASRWSLRPRPGDLGSETRELAAVRALIAAGLSSRARDSLDHYDATFPQGVLRPEAAVLRIELAAATGDLSGARRLARAFESDYPRSSHLHKVRALVEPAPRISPPNADNGPPEPATAPRLVPVP